MPLQLKPRYCIEKLQKMQEKASKFGHIFVENKYETLVASFSKNEIQSNSTKQYIPSEREAIVKIRCSAHPEKGIQETTVANYLRSRIGLPCCGKAQVGQKLKNRIFSEETRKKMSESKKKYYQKYLKRRKPKSILQPKFYWSKWRQIVLQNGKYVCAITGFHARYLEAHHLFSKKVFLSIQFEPENGILLAAEIHRAFHKKYGTLNVVTIDHFLDFLQLLQNDPFYRNELFKKVSSRFKRTNFQKPISNQLSSRDKGSETTNSLNSQQNILRLYENMEKLREKLFYKLTDQEKELALQAFQTPIVARFYEMNNKQRENSFEEDQNSSFL